MQLEQIAVAELHPLADDVAEGRDVGDDGGFVSFAEGVFAVVHHGAVVVRNAQIAGGGVVVRVEVVLFPWRSDANRGHMCLIAFDCLFWHFKGFQLPTVGTF